MIRYIAKASSIIFMMCNHVLICSLAKLVIRDSWERKNLFISLVHKNCKLAMAVFGFHVEIINPEKMEKDKTYFIVANHMSYIDPLIMAVLRPLCFVTSMEMRETPVLGLLTDVGGCLYVERRSKENIIGEIEEIITALKRNMSVVIFPEATSTDGSALRPFKRPLYSAALQANCAVLPIYLEYAEINGEKTNSKNRDSICWYGDMGFTKHFFQIFRIRRAKIRLTICDPIVPAENETRDSLMEKSQTSIQQVFIPIQ
ncbi:MAG: 1-acyl-sn-glycerol-3-phosphate acyltransferase [Oligoflexia bacterium]|nr:1-acyl-sn-glycerol-3-phosphate acyltransferase [Oligoflexia bacterium]